MALAQAQGAGPVGPAVDPRAARRALRAERAQLAHWRRLLRARLDLAVAGLAPPEHLGSFTWEVLPDAAVLLPRTHELSEAVRVAEDVDVVDLLTRLRRLDRMLSRYADQLDGAIEETTQELLTEQAAAPRGANRAGDAR
ncbi:hypothetical protein N866_17050 [Actinotalea ferrariae CF5-4]|uniref:Uncharacterized protein n=1 Tax=Actinotalea ferrariae CF5-4 TaxID=948458 RepID=A0A021VV74_9CELL|nr:hypothetical protein [Actinotalea ferrariae]EYR63935.1 hypothetical protein N866_17050 [Actinotalea ferrariae CF5-4]